MGRLRKSEHVLGSRAHPARARLSYKAPAYLRLCRLHTRRGEQDGGHRVTVNSPPRPEIRLPPLHAFLVDQALASDPPDIHVQVVAN